MCPVHNPITSSIRKPNHAETKSRNDMKKRLKTRKQFKAPGFDPCHSWESSWGGGLENVRHVLIATSRKRRRTLVNVGEDTTLGDGDVAQKLVQFLIVTDGELEMTGNDTGLLVVTGGVTSQLENFSSEIFEDGSQVDRST